MQKAELHPPQNHWYARTPTKNQSHAPTHIRSINPCAFPFSERVRKRNSTDMASPERITVPEVGERAEANSVDQIVWDRARQQAALQRRAHHARAHARSLKKRKTAVMNAVQQQVLMHPITLSPDGHAQPVIDSSIPGNDLYVPVQWPSGGGCIASEFEQSRDVSDVDNMEVDEDVTGDDHLLEYESTTTQQQRGMSRLRQREYLDR